MTTSSVQFLSSRRVQLVGLPQPTTSSQQQPVVSNPAFARVDPVFTPRRVSRNLFGSPKPGEVKELLHKETAQRRSYILQRYNFDIFCPQKTESTASKCIKSAPVTQNQATQSEDASSLIAKELIDHEKRLDGEVCISHRSETSPSQTNWNIQLNETEKVQETETFDGTISEPKDIEKITESCSSIPRASQNRGGSDRLKPYDRQTLITDCYSLRKRRISYSKSNAIPSSVVDLHQKPIEAHKSVPLVESSISPSAAPTDPVIEDENKYEVGDPFKQRV